MSFDEECPCGAKVSVPIVQIGASSGWDRAVEQIKDWRANHRHEPPAPHVECAPQIVDVSGAHIEKAVPFGFTREPMGGWGE